MRRTGCSQGRPERARPRELGLRRRQKRLYGEDADPGDGGHVSVVRKEDGALGEERSGEMEGVRRLDGVRRCVSYEDIPLCVIRDLAQIHERIIPPLPLEPPVVRIPAQVHHGQDEDPFGLDAVEDAVGEPVHQAASDFAFKLGSTVTTRDQGARISTGTSWMRSSR